MSNSDTPRTDSLEDGIRRRKELRGFGMPEDDRDRVALCRQLERDLAAANKRADEQLTQECKELRDELAAANRRATEAQEDLSVLATVVRTGANPPTRAWTYDIYEKSAKRALELHRRADAAEAALSKINDLRNDIIGRQSISWSNHVYHLVAILDDAGQQALGYEAARAKAMRHD